MNEPTWAHVRWMSMAEEEVEIPAAIIGIDNLVVRCGCACAPSTKYMYWDVFVSYTEYRPGGVGWGGIR
jgi:hypothetical protein